MTRLKPYTTVYTNRHSGTNQDFANEEIEVFKALWLAKDAFWRRANDPTDPHYAIGVDKASCYMDVYLKDEDGTYTPHCRFTIGPRGAVP